eukprot:jgi/Chlat1/1821/Chrsp138S02147
MTPPLLQQRTAARITTEAPRRRRPHTSASWARRQPAAHPASNRRRRVSAACGGGTEGGVRVVEDARWGWRGTGGGDAVREAAGSAYLTTLGGLEIMENVAYHATRALVPPRKVDAAQQPLPGRVAMLAWDSPPARPSTPEAPTSKERGEAAAAALLRSGNSGNNDCNTQLKGQVETMPLDLASLASVRGFARAIATKGLHVDVLVNNAGIMAPLQREETADGFEAQFQVNYLSHFLLTNLLTSARMKVRPQSGPMRVVTLTSMTHVGGAIDFADIHSRRRYLPFGAYAQSKLANVLAARELQRRHPVEEVVSVAVHPGLVDTTLARNYFLDRTPRPLQPLLQCCFRFLLRTPQDAAASVLFALTSPPPVVAGAYVAGGRVVPGSRSSHDAELAGRLWRASRDMAGVSE